MKKYNPNESITCPKCGRTYVAEVMGVRYVPIYQDPLFQDDPPHMILTSLCGFSVQRRPLDYKE